MQLNFDYLLMAFCLYDYYSRDSSNWSKGFGLINKMGEMITTFPRPEELVFRPDLEINGATIKEETTEIDYHLIKQRKGGTCVIDNKSGQILYLLDEWGRKIGTEEERKPIIHLSDFEYTNENPFVFSASIISKSRIKKYEVYLNNIKLETVYPVEKQYPYHHGYKDSYKKTLELREGLNTIRMEAINADKAMAVGECKVLYEPNEPISEKPLIVWNKMPSSTNQSQIAFKAQIKSDSKIDFCKLYLNGNEVPITPAPSGSEVVLDKDDHNITINETLSLVEGKNIIEIKVANQGGVTEESRTIQYTKPVVGAERALIVWSEIPSTTKSPDFTVNAEIKSTSKNISYQVLLNGTEQTYGTKGSYVVPDEKKDGEYRYSTPVNRTLTLMEGNNSIQIIVKGSKGETLTSKQQDITYAKPEPPVIVWEGTYPEKTTKEQLLVKATINSKSEITDWKISLSSSGKTKGSNVVKDVVENGKSKSVSKTVTLKPGYNTIEVEVTNADGIKATKQKEIWYSPCEKRIALVIGNQNYSHFDRLKKCRNDADTIANLLEKECSFDIIIVKDANYITMNNKINEFIDRVKIENYSTAIIYYSGHGLSFSSEKGDNYLIPIDCSNCKEDVERYGFDVKTKLLDRLDNEAKGSCNVKIAMLDCCRQSELNLCNSAPGSTIKGTMSSKGLSKMDIPYGIAVFYGAEFGHVSYDGDSYNSPYVKCFVEYFRSHPKANWRDLGFDVSEMVKDATKDYKDNYGNKAPQIPQHEINKFHGAKDFYLNPYHDKP